MATTPRVLGKDTTNPLNKEVQLLENKVNKLRHLNDSLSKEVFDAIQRGHRLAVKLGYQDLDDAERSLATQANGSPEEQQSQLEQLSQYPVEELAGHVQALQAELVSHVQLSKSTLNALQDALEEMTGLREENERLRRELEEKQMKQDAVGNPGESAHGLAKELAYVRAELATLKRKHAALREAKDKADEKHAKDYKTWKEFKEYYEEHEARKRTHKRRKLTPVGEDDKGDGSNGGGDKGEGSAVAVTKRAKTPIMDRIHKKSRTRTIRSRPGLLTPARSSQGPPPSPILTSKDLNSSSSPTPTSSGVPTPTKRRDIKPLPRRKSIKREPSVRIPDFDEVPGSSQTEPDSQPVQYLYASQQDVVDAPPSTAPQQRPRSPAPDRDSSETEPESQGPAFIFPREIVPLTPAQVKDMTPKPRPGLRREKQQLHTPVSLPRPVQLGKGKEQVKLETVTMPPPSSPLRSDRSRSQALSTLREPCLPETPVSLPTKKGKERVTAIENDENAPDSTGSAPSTPSKKHPSNYSIYKGRGRYGAELQAGKETINARYEIDPERNNGVNFQFEEVVRDKGKRKQMHAADCECCRDYYEAVGPLPSRLQPPMWRSPQSKKRTRDSFEDNEDDDWNAAAIEEHKQKISRHRQHWARAATPPGYWNIGFPDTQEVEQMNAEATRMHQQKQALVAQEAQRGGKYRKR